MRSLFLVIVLLWVLPAQAQPLRDAQRATRTNDYTKAIDLLLPAGTAIGDVDTPARKVLGAALRQRGFFLRDLAHYQIHVGLDYYTQRDSNTHSVNTPWNTYYLGRYQFEAGDHAGAARSFAKAIRTNGLPAVDQQRARLWQNAVATRSSDINPKPWPTISTSAHPILAIEKAYVQWHVGQPTTQNVRIPTEPTIASLRARVWAAAQEQPGADLIALQRQLLAQAWPDYEHKVDDQLTLSYHDPATLQIAAFADLMACIQVLEAVDPFQAGLCAFEAGAYTQARELFDRNPGGGSTQARQPIYMGALDYADGREQQASQHWASMTDAPISLQAEWFDISTQVTDGQLSTQQEQVLQSILVRVRERPETLRARNPQEWVWRLGRALVRIQRYEAALEVFDAFYPVALNNQLARIQPAYLVTFTHVRYKLGAHAETMGHVAALARGYAIAHPAHTMTKSVTAPRAKRGKKRTG